jgi:hypothetical protein
MGLRMSDQYLLDDYIMSEISLHLQMFCRDYIQKFKKPYPIHLRERLLRNLIICAIEKEDYEITNERAKTAIEDALKEAGL